MLSGRAARMVTFLYHSLFKDIERWNAICLSKSESTLIRRIEAEGFSFCTVILPTLGKALDRVLSGGLWERPPMFKAKASGDVRPAFLFELFSLVLDSKGLELSKPSITAVKDIRQISGLFYKYELPFSDVTVKKAWLNLKEVDSTLVKPKLSGDILKVIDLAHTLLCELLAGVDPKSGIPGHGPGSVGEGLPNWEKSLFSEIPTDKVLKYYGFEHFLHTPLDAQRSMSKYGHKMHYKKQVEPVSVFGCVPKDSRGPRIVCKEYVTNQFVQQAAKATLYELIEQHPLTSGQVNFTDQTINGKLALWGSHVERDIVTLDMKDASNRILWWLVKMLFPANWVEMLDATRSEYIRNGSEKYGPINMYAPMGSALSFPIESLVHWSIAVSSITLVMGMDLTHVLKHVYVYGDDIVLRGLPYKVLFPIFEKLGMCFNESKCCTGGHFRESCGTDAYRGELVSPLRIKKPILSSGAPEVLVAAVEYANSAYNDGLHSLAKALQLCIADLWPQRIPYVTANADAIGYFGNRGNGSCGLIPLSDLKSLKYSSDLQLILHKACGTTGKAFKGNTDWCRYRDTLRALASRSERKIRPLDFLFPGPRCLVGARTEAPTYRHSLFMTKILSREVVTL